MMLEMMILDFFLVGGFIGLWIGVILFRRFHQYECLVNPKEIGPTAWGTYNNRSSKP